MWCTVTFNNPVPVCGSHDQLVVRDQQVIWYEGTDPSTQTVRKVYNVETTVLQAFWCNFSEGGATGCGSIVIREQDTVGIYMESGAIHYIPFPFPVSSCDVCLCYYSCNALVTCPQVKWVWPLDSGLLVERLMGADSAYDGLPTLFSLLHPMDDFCPVTCHRPTASE